MKSDTWRRKSSSKPKKITYEIEANKEGSVRLVYKIILGYFVVITN